MSRSHLHGLPFAYQIQGFNKLNEHVNKLVPILKDALSPMLAGKILKADGSFSAAFKAALPDYQAEGFSWFPHASRYSVTLEAKFQLAYGGVTYYFEETVYIIDIANAPKLYEFENLPAFNAETVKATQEKIERLKEEINQLKRTLPHQFI